MGSLWSRPRPLWFSLELFNVIAFSDLGNCEKVSIITFFFCGSQTYIPIITNLAIKMDGGDGGEPENIWSIDRGAVTSKLSCCHQELKPRIVRSSNVKKNNNTNF